MKILIIAIVLAFALSAPAVAASDVQECTAVGTAEGETLYYCEDVGCYWDPSSIVQTGMLECE